MTFRFHLTILSSLILANPLFAAESRSDLLFQLSSALHSRDRAALARCFNFQGTTEADRVATLRILEQIITWPTHYVTTTEREGTEPLLIERDNRKYTLNGDWTFQVHIHIKPPPSKGFVFPAGTSHGKYLVLLTVEKKP